MFIGSPGEYLREEQYRRVDDGHPQRLRARGPAVQAARVVLQGARPARAQGGH